MSIKTGTVILLQDCSLGIEQGTVVGQAMAGHKPADIDPGYNDERHILKFATPADTVAGLFDPTPHQNFNVHPFCMGVQLVVGAAVTWDVYVTNGLGAAEGSPTASEVDDPDYDMPVDSGTGPAYVKPYLELFPGQKIRVVTAAAATIDTRVVVLFANTIGAGGRLIS